MMILKSLVPKMLTILLITNSCSKTETNCSEILNTELRHTKTILETEIKHQNSFIDMKVSERPFLKPSFDSLKKIKLDFDTLISKNQIQQKDTVSIKKLKKKLEKISHENFDFTSLLRTTKIEDQLFLKILESDILKAKYKLNTKYIDKHCNSVY